MCEAVATTLTERQIPLLAHRLLAHTTFGPDNTEQQFTGKQHMTPPKSGSHPPKEIERSRLGAVRVGAVRSGGGPGKKSEPVLVGAVRGGASLGGGGLVGGGLGGGGPGGGLKFALFISSPDPLCFLFSFFGFFVELWWVPPVFNIEKCSQRTNLGSLDIL